MQSVRYRIAALSVVIALVALVTGPASAAFIDLTPQGNADNSVDSVALGDLVSGDVEGIVVGDKIFTGFIYSEIGDMPTAADVNVLGFRDLSGNWGLSFHGAFLDLPGGGASDALVRFMVEVDPESAAQGWRIHDAHLSMGGVGLGDDSFLSVDESFQESNDTMSVFASTLGPGTDQQLSDSVFFGQLVTKLNVTKDILALAAEGSTQATRTTVIDQSFSQVLIPEPSSVALIGIALAVFGWVGARGRLIG